MAHPQKNPGMAAVLSVIVPGIGQFYNGDFLRRIFWLIVTPGFWIGRAACSGGCVRRRWDDGAPPCPGEERAARMNQAAPTTGHRSPGQDTGSRGRLLYDTKPVDIEGIVPSSPGTPLAQSDGV